MRITKTKTVTNHYNIKFPCVMPFTTFDVICKVRGGLEKVRRQGNGKCFYCEKNFKDKQDIYLGLGVKSKNRLFCQNCYKTLKAADEEETLECDTCGEYSYVYEGIDFSNQDSQGNIYIKCPNCQQVIDLPAGSHQMQKGQSDGTA